MLPADWTARHSHCIQLAGRVQVTSLGAGGKAAAGGSGGGGDWDEKPASEPWCEQEQHKKVCGPLWGQVLFTGDGCTWDG